MYAMIRARTNEDMALVTKNETELTDLQVRVKGKDLISIWKCYLE